MTTIVQAAFSAAASGDSDALEECFRKHGDPFQLIRSTDDDPSTLKGIGGADGTEGSNIAAVNADGSSFLLIHIAAERGHLSCVEFLLRCPGETNPPTAVSHSTPLHLAAWHGHDKVCAAILDSDQGEAALARDADGRTALCLARLGKHRKVVRLLHNHMTESLSLAPPPAPSYSIYRLPHRADFISASSPHALRSGGASCLSVCAVSPGFTLAVGVRASTTTFEICTPAQVSEKLFSEMDSDNRGKECGSEGDLPLRWVKVKIVCSSDTHERNDPWENDDETVDGSPPQPNRSVRARPSEPSPEPQLLLARPIDFPLVVRNLRPGLTYRVDIAAVNCMGAGPYGQCGACSSSSPARSGPADSPDPANSPTEEMNQGGGCHEPQSKFMEVRTPSRLAEFVRRCLAKLGAFALPHRTKVFSFGGNGGGAGSAAGAAAVDTSKGPRCRGGTKDTLITTPWPSVLPRALTSWIPEPPLVSSSASSSPDSTFTASVAAPPPRQVPWPPLLHARVVSHLTRCFRKLPFVEKPSEGRVVVKEEEQGRERFGQVPCEDLVAFLLPCFMGALSRGGGCAPSDSPSSSSSAAAAAAVTSPSPSRRLRRNGSPSSSGARELWEEVAGQLLAVARHCHVEALALRQHWAGGAGGGEGGAQSPDKNQNTGEGEGAAGGGGKRESWPRKYSAWEAVRAAEAAVVGFWLLASRHELSLRLFPQRHHDHGEHSYGRRRQRRRQPPPPQQQRPPIPSPVRDVTSSASSTGAHLSRSGTMGASLHKQQQQQREQESKSVRRSQVVGRVNAVEALLDRVTAAAAVVVAGSLSGAPDVGLVNPAQHMQSDNLPEEEEEGTCGREGAQGRKGGGSVAAGSIEEEAAGRAAAVEKEAGVGAVLAANAGGGEGGGDDNAEAEEAEADLSLALSELAMEAVDADLSLLRVSFEDREGTPFGGTTGGGAATDTSFGSAVGAGGGLGSTALLCTLREEGSEGSTAAAAAAASAPSEFSSPLPPLFQENSSPRTGGGEGNKFDHAMDELAFEAVEAEKLIRASQETAVGAPRLGEKLGDGMLPTHAMTSSPLASSHDPGGGGGGGSVVAAAAAAGTFRLSPDDNDGGVVDDAQAGATTEMPTSIGDID